MNRIAKRIISFLSLAAVRGKPATGVAVIKPVRALASGSGAWVLLLALSAVAAPAFAQNTILVNKSFGATSITPGGTTSMTITLENTDTAGPQVGMAFADNFPAGLTWTSITSNSCGGTLAPATGPAGTLGLTGGTIAAATGSGTSTCQIVLQVAASTTGGKTNTIPAGAVTAAVNGNATQNGTGAAATLLVTSSAPVSLSKVLSPGTITVSGVTMMTLTLTNPNAFAITNANLSDNFATDVTRAPAGPGSLQVAAGASSTTCGGTLSAVAGSGLVNLTGATIPAGGSCTVTVPLSATTDGIYTNTIPAGRLTSDQDATNIAATAAVSVQEGLQVSKASGFPATATLGTTAAPTFTVVNPFSQVVNNVGYTDTFPDANGNGVPDFIIPAGSTFTYSPGCGPSAVATALPNGGGFTLSGASIAPDSYCQVQIVSMMANDVVNGSINQILPGAVTGTLADNTPVTNSNVAEWTHNIVADGNGGFVLRTEKYLVESSGLIMSMYPPHNKTIAPGATQRVRIWVRNPNGFSATGGTLSDTFQATTVEGNTSDMVLASPANFTFLNCGEAGNTFFNPANGFTTAPVPPSAVPNGGGNGFTVSNLSVLKNSNDGADGSQTNGGRPCQISFDVTATTIGRNQNILFEGAGTAFQALDAPVGITGTGYTVRNFPDVNDRVYVTVAGPLAATKTFFPTFIATDTGVARLTIELRNSSTVAVLSAAFTDNFPVSGPAGQLVAGVPNPGSTCGGAITAVPNAGSWSFSGGVIPAAVGGIDGVCTVSIDVISSSGNNTPINLDWSGNFLNTIPVGGITGDIGGTTVFNAVAASGPLASGALALVATKSFSPATIQGGGLSDLTIQINNPSTGPLTGVQVTDNLPTGMIIADPVVTSTTCVGAPVINAVALASSFSMTGAEIAAGQSCTVTVKVTAVQTGTLTNTLQPGDASSSNGAGNVDAFSANLVVQPRVGLGKQFIPDRIPVGGTSELEIRVFNANNSPATNISITDNMPAQVVLAAPLTFSVVPGTTCPGVNVTGTPGNSSLTLSNLTLPAFTECRVRILVTSDVVSVAPHWINTILPTDVSSLEGGINTDDATDELEVYAAPAVTKSFSDASIQLGETSTLTIRVTNPATSGSITSLVFTDNLPTGIVIADVPNVTTNANCASGTVTGGTAGATSVGWTGGTLAFGEFCEITVAVKGTAVGNYVNVLPADTAACGLSAGGQVCNPDPAEAAIEVIDFPAALTFVKSLVAENGTVAGAAEPGEQLTYNIVITNTGGAAANVPVVDVVPANTTFVSADNGGVLNGAQVDWTVNVPETGSLTLAVVFQVVDPIPAGVTEIANSVTVDGVACATVPCVTTPVLKPEFNISKALTGENGATAGVAEPGEELTYTITVANTSAIDAINVPVIDIVPANTSYVSSSNGGALNGAQVEWTLATLAANSSTTLTVTFAVANPLPVGLTSIANSATVEVPGEPPVTCATVPCVTTPTGDFDIDFTKTLTGENGTTTGVAEPGEQLTYTITINNNGAANAVGIPVVDLVPANTAFVSATAGGVLNGSQVDWTVDVAAGGSVSVTVTFAVVDPIPAGVTEIANSATVDGQSCVTVPCVTTPTSKPTFTIAKVLSAESGSQGGLVEPGEELTYTINVSNTSGVDAAAVPVIDIVPQYLTYVSSSNGGTLAGNQVEWSLAVPANSSQSITVTFRVDATLPAGIEQIANSATVNPPGEPPVVCTNVPCVETPVAQPELEIGKVLSAENGTVPGQVEPGEQLTYNITVSNISGIDAVDVSVSDIIPANTTFVSADNGGTLNGSEVQWTLPTLAAGQSQTLIVVFQMASPIPAGVRSIINNATVDFPTNPEPPVTCTTVPCVTTPVVLPPIAVDDDGGTHPAGLPVTVTSPGNDIATSAPLDPTTVHIVGTANPGDPLTVPGEGTWTVDPVTGAITFTPQPGFTGTPTPIRYTIDDILGQTSNEALVTLDYVIEQLLRITKKASVRNVVIGDLVRYTITLENLGTVDLTGVELIDTPALGFSLVAASLNVIDVDNSGALNGINPVRVGGLDIPVGQTATVSYLMTVGANVLPGTHINTVQGYINDVPISNVATATVVSKADPLFEESLILGTVFNDRDEDGWQDSAEATDVLVQGGVDESVYIAGSTTVDRGNGPQPEADASAPLNHGIDLGTLHGRSTIAEPEDSRKVIISQRLSEPKFNTDFVLTTGQGTTVRVNAAGESSVTRTGRAEDGLTAQDIRVNRVVTPDNGAYRVDYVVTNAGVQEQGIPGVRIGTVEGLLIETDRYGRYHLEGISPSNFARGSNFVLKVDAATLPSGSKFTTENPRVRRITPGIPVRFDFGVKMIEEVLEAANGDVNMSLGEVVFEANSAVIRPAYEEVIDFIAGKVKEHGGGEVDIVGYGGNPELAYARAKAVQTAVGAKVDASLASELKVTVRGEVDGPEVLSFGHRKVLGEVFFDTDKTLIKPAFVPVIEKIATDIEAGGVPEVLITGHADKRASDAYNVDLGKRRAKSVYDAIAAQLSAARKEKLHVEYLPPSSSEERYIPGKSE